MKICWDNIENLRLTKNGNFIDVVSNHVYYYVEKCIVCGYPFLGRNKDTKLCSNDCKHRNRIGTILSEETKKKIGESNKGKTGLSGRHNHMYGKTGKLNPMYGKHHTEESRKKIRDNHADMKGSNNPMYGKHRSEETRKKISEANSGYHSKGLPTYDTYAHQIDWIEEVRRNPDDPNVLEVRCTYCGKWYIPNLYNLRSRIQILKGNEEYRGEQRFYCSDACKSSCPIYHRKPEDLIREDSIRAGNLSWLELNREVQPELRQMVLERDNYECQKCGATDKPLHCHHILPVAVEPLLSADVDNCITLCEDCHKAVHKLPGCGYNEIKMEIC